MAKNVNRTAKEIRCGNRGNVENVQAMDYPWIVRATMLVETRATADSSPHTTEARLRMKMFDVGARSEHERRSRWRRRL